MWPHLSQATEHVGLRDGVQVVGFDRAGFLWLRDTIANGNRPQAHLNFRLAKSLVGFNDVRARLRQCRKRGRGDFKSFLSYERGEPSLAPRGDEGAVKLGGAGKSNIDSVFGRV